ncbi:MAG: hypothetical protein PVI33_02405 [Candidatus Omnitrophota bacterium]|jgi:hypothetical protein
MNLTKFFIIILAVTLLALLYVYQESKIIHSAYQEQERLALLETLVDRNKNLRYNIDRQMSLVSLSEIWQDGDFEWPGSKYLVSAHPVQQSPTDKKQIIETGSLFTRLFGLKSKAEARSIKPR